MAIIHPELLSHAIKLAEDYTNPHEFEAMKANVDKTAAGTTLLTKRWTESALVTHRNVFHYVINNHDGSKAKLLTEAIAAAGVLEHYMKESKLLAQLKGSC